MFGGNDGGERGCEVGAAADELRTEDDLLLAVLSLGLYEIESAGGDQGAGAGEFDGGKSSFFDLCCVIFGELLYGG